MPVVEESILNVTLLPPREKHPTIFARFDELAEGESFIIHNDHDPKPLYYQLLGERGNIFTWEYLEQGPEWWKVRIGKRISGQNEETLGQIVAKDLRKAEVFKKYGLDFCCGGRKTVKEACREKGLDVAKIEQELQDADKNPVTRPLPYGEWPVDFLADYIVNTHHSYVRKALPELKMYAAKVTQVHSDKHPELQLIQQLIAEMNTELLGHMIKEEKVLFPYIKENVKVATSSESPKFESHFDIIQNPVRLMEMEHEIAGRIMQEIRQLTNDFTLPHDACATYSLLYRMLEEFESDLHLHIHLENNILFPKAIEMEKS